MGAQVSAQPPPESSRFPPNEVLHTVGAHCPSASEPARVTLHMYGASGSSSGARLLDEVLWALGMGSPLVAVEVYGVQWNYSKVGVSWGKPGQNEGCVHVRSSSLGQTFKSRNEVLTVLSVLIARYHREYFNHAVCNSTHFAKELSDLLGVGPYPAWATFPKQEGSECVVLQVAGSVCCLDQEGTPVDREEIPKSGASPDPALSEETQLRFEQWADAHVNSLEKRPQAHADKPGAAYQLVRERWLRARRGKSAWSSAYSVQLPRCSELYKPEAAGPGEDPLAVVGPDASESEVGQAALEFKVSVPCDSNGKFGIAVALAKGEEESRGILEIVSVDTERTDLEALRVGDIVTCVDGVTVASPEEFESMVSGEASKKAAGKPALRVGDIVTCVDGAVASPEEFESMVSGEASKKAGALAPSGSPAAAEDEDPAPPLQRTGSASKTVSFQLEASGPGQGKPTMSRPTMPQLDAEVVLGILRPRIKEPEVAEPHGSLADMGDPGGDANEEGSPKSDDGDWAALMDHAALLRQLPTVGSREGTEEEDLEIQRLVRVTDWIDGYVDGLSCRRPGKAWMAVAALPPRAKAAPPKVAAVPPMARLMAQKPAEDGGVWQAPLGPLPPPTPGLARELQCGRVSMRTTTTPPQGRPWVPIARPRVVATL